MFDLIKGKKLLLIVGLSLSLLAALANFWLMFLSGWLIASAGVAGISGVVAQNAFNMTLPATGVRFFAVLRILARYGERLVNHDVALRAIGLMRSWSFRKLVPHSTDLVRQSSSGDFLNRFVNDTDKMGQVFLEVLNPVYTAVGGSIVALFFIGFFDFKCALVLALGLITGGIALPYLTQRLVAKTTVESAKQSEKLQSEIVETLHALDDLLICGSPENRLRLLGRTQNAINGAITHEFKYANLLRQALGFIAMCTVLGVVLCAHSAYKAQTITAPEIAMLGLGALASFEFLAPLVDAQLQFERYKRAKERVMEICDRTAPSRESDENSETGENGFDKTALLSARNLSFDTPEGRKILDKISLDLRKGDRIAILGESGAGKSTLARILAGLMPPTSGQVTVGGDAPDYRGDTHKKIGMLTQDFHLFSGTVKDNLLIANAKADEADLWRALEQAGLDDEIRAMPKGLDESIGERGVKLSGGQARRLAAAQILLQKPDVLLLDEPTESLPPEQGSALMASLTKNLPDAGVLCITHRKEPLPFMHRIYRLDKGLLES